MPAVSPPLSPWLLVGLALRPLPLFPLQPALAFTLWRLRRRHPGVFDRLSEVGDRSFAVHPVELPFAVRLSFTRGEPTLRACPAADAGRADGVVRGPLIALYALMEGRIDGDALFFARTLSFEGDTAAVVALRNALDGAGIDLLEEMLRSLGILEHPARLLLERAGRLVERAGSDLETVRRAALGPVARELAALERRIGAIEAVPKPRPRRDARLEA